MLIFLIMLAITVGLYIFVHYLDKKDATLRLNMVCTIFSWIGTFVATFMLVFVIINNATGNIEYEKAMAEREVIEYQLENQTFVNDNFVGASELFTQVGEFNGKVKSHQMYHNSIWTSWFYSGIWDKIELIDISQYNIQG